MTPLFAQHIHVAGKRGQHMEMLMTLGHQAGVKRAHRRDMPSRFLVQSFLCAPDAAHKVYKLRAASMSDYLT